MLHVTTAERFSPEFSSPPFTMMMHPHFDFICWKSQQLMLSIRHFVLVCVAPCIYVRMFLVIWHVQMAPELFWSLSISNLQTESFTRFNSVSHHRHRPTIECMEKTSDKSKNYFVENFSPNYNYVYGVCAYNMLGGPWQWWCSALVLHDLRFENAMRTQNRCNWKCFRRTKIKYAHGTSLCWILNELFVPSAMPFDWFVRRPNDAHI